MKKSFVLDTNIILSNARCIFNFEEHDIIIPLTVISELDNFKKGMDELGRNARHFSNIIDEFRTQGKLHEGVQINDKGGMIKVVPCEQRFLTLLPPELDTNINDNKIIAVAAFYKAILVSKDTNIRIIADTLGVKTENYKNDRVEIDDLYTGRMQVQGKVNELTEPQVAPFEKLELETTPYPNQFIEVIEHHFDKDDTITCRYQPETIHTPEQIFPLRTDLESWGLKPRNSEQTMAMDLLLDDDIKLVTISGSSGTGKTLLSIACALRKVTDEFKYRKILISRPVMPMGKDIGFLPGPQPLDSKILTPDGWVTMGSLKIGDTIISGKGTPTKVIGIFPKGKKSVYKIHTTEGCTTECCEDHLWYTTTSENRKRGKGGNVKTTKDIMNSLYNKFGKLNHHIPRNGVIEFSENEIPFSPYVLGILLGDGSISNSIMFSSKDEEIVYKMENELKKIGCFIKHHKDTINYSIIGSLYNNKPAKSIKITNNETGEIRIYESIGIALDHINLNRSTLHNRAKKQMSIDGYTYQFIDDAPIWQNPIKNELSKIGLIGTKSHDKFIPDIFKYSSIEHRIELLRGLMDSDGSIGKNGNVTFTTTSQQLADDVSELVKSLGGRAVVFSRDRIGCKSSYNNIITRRITYEFGVSLPPEINPFYLPRKAERFKSKYMHGVCINDIIYEGEKEVQCILIDDQDHLYITDNFLVTHNTMEDKLSPYMQPIYDNIEFLMSGYSADGAGKKRKRTKKEQKVEEEKQIGELGSGYLELLNAGIMQVEPLLYIRGRSIPNQILIVDEAQNLDIASIKAILTRAGEGTKIIVTGDIEQIDSPLLDVTNNGLTYIIDRAKTCEFVGHVTLKKCERSALAEWSAKNL